MADFLSPQERSHRMSLIRSRDTKPELAMRDMLDDAKIPYKRFAELPGTPDFLSGNVAIFVNGVFWHGKKFDQIKHKLKPFWLDKIANNMRRDRRVDRQLRRLGFSVLRVWETDLRQSRRSRCLARIRRAISRPSPSKGLRCP